MEPTKELIDALYRDKLRWARAIPPEEKLILGVRLFDRVCRVMADGIRQQYPEGDEAQVQEILRQRLALARRLEGEAGDR